MRTVIALLVIAIVGCVAETHLLKKLLGDDAKPLGILGFDEGRGAFMRKLGVPLSNQFDFTNAKKLSYKKGDESIGQRFTLTYDRKFAGVKLSEAKFNGTVYVNAHSNLRNNIEFTGEDEGGAGGKTMALTLMSIEDNTGIPITEVVIFSCNLGKSKKFTTSMEDTLRKHRAADKPVMRVAVTRYINNRFAGGILFLKSCCDTVPTNDVGGLVITDTTNLGSLDVLNAKVTTPSSIKGESFFTVFTSHSPPSLAQATTDSEADRLLSGSEPEDE